MSVSVRRIAGHEGVLLKALRLEALADSPEAFGETLAEAAGRDQAEYAARARAASEGDRRAWFLALPRGPSAPVGLIMGRRRPPRDCMVFSMWVAPSARRGGVGRALVAAVEAWARGWGATSLVLWVYRSNRDALRFYRRLGFEAVARGPDAEAGAPHDALALCRSIEPPAGPPALVAPAKAG